jgi:hypothetical protein
MEPYCVMKEFFNFILIQKLKAHYPQYPKENIFFNKNIEQDEESTKNKGTYTKNNTKAPLTLSTY